MTTLRGRIVMTWVAFAIMGMSFLVGGAHIWIIAACCLAISVMRSQMKPPFPRMRSGFERRAAMLVFAVMIVCLLPSCLILGEWWVRAARIGLWVAMPLLLIIAAREDARVWKLASARHVA